MSTNVDAGAPTSEQVPERPVLRIIRGAPTAAELAALIAVVAAASAVGEADAPRRRSAWAAPDRSMRVPLNSGGWRSSLAPR
ncbi:unannotated protein [freshwater metagenome]|uniref:Unannotated protein n=1 Tax=freshwater metagenome TaxID=449393 RepID=A0A6J7RQB1_9ZZZZ